jgi:hypothetical protein
MNTITIGFSKPNSFKLHAWIIEKIDGARFDHAYLKFHSASLNRDIIYQAVGKGVEFVGSALWLSTTQPVEEYQFTLDDATYTSMMQFCVDNAGVSYGFLGVLGAGMVDIAGKFGKQINNPFVKKGTLSTEFCSEIIARVLGIADPSQFNLNAANVTPNTLNKLIKSLNIPRTL